MKARAEQYLGRPDATSIPNYYYIESSRVSMLKSVTVVAMKKARINCPSAQ